MEQSQISIRPNQEYTPPPPLALFFPQEGGGEDSAHLAPSFPSRAEVEALLGVGAWPAVLVTVPKLPQNGPLRSLPPSLPSLSLPLLPSLRIDVLVRITTHPRHVPSIRLLTYLPSFDHRLHSAPSPSTRSARFPRFSNSVNVTAETTSVRGSRDRVHRTDSFRALLLEYTCLDTCSPVSIVVIIGQKRDRSSSRIECASSPTPLLSIRIYGKEERSFMLPESKFPVTGGTMQTEEIVSRTQSTGIDGGPTDSASLQHHLHHTSHIKCPLPPLLHMAVKQEPQEEEERSRDTNALSPQVDADTSPTSVDGKLGHGHETGHHHQIQELEETPGQTVADLNNRGRQSRGRRKSRWKLKFHHQALPPEYLDHYEASLAQEALNSSPTRLTEPTIASPAPTSSTSTPSPIADVHGWLQRIAAMQQELCPQISSGQCSTMAPNNANQASVSRRSVITSTSSHALNNTTTTTTTTTTHHHNHNQQQQQSPSQACQARPPMKYSDLPYMGEITLDNSKPRRGRKPKKADICHLIYKNYGTILPGTPGHEERRLSPRGEKLDCRERISPHTIPFQRSDVQNRISSLLEKRLTQESRRTFDVVENSAREQDEPLNLCIRDLNQLKIRLLRKHGNVYESGQVKSETSSDGEEVECIGSTFPTETSYRPLLDPLVVRNSGSNVNHNNNIIDPMLATNPGFVYWPNAGVFIHPMALQSQLLYYQKMAQNDKCYPRGLDQGPKEQRIVPKSIYSMMEAKSPPLVPAPPATVQPLTPVQTVPPVQPPVSPRPKRNAPVAQAQGGQPTKRKRSAIFIPPMPTENNNNPATEVSICKFKFTGGAKPSLQEKKSLSVDSGGNFRYYSGTGDKSMRGYEFFPREALQQSAGQSASSTGAFLNAAGERIQPPPCQRSGGNNQEEGRRKRKTRKSLQREKLEQTFKEKGFLIQTQQLESAEGATYCKFRQLRKFTRYLFRSWKDYLPGNVRELTGATDNEIGDGDAESDTNVLPSPVPNMVDVPSAFVDEHRALPLT